MSLDTVTQSLKRKLNFAPPGPAAPRRLQSRRAPPGGAGGQDWGSSARPLPSSGSGENPCLLTAPHPPTQESLVRNRKEMRNVPSIGRRLPVPGRLLGTARGARGAALLLEVVQTRGRSLLPPWPGVQASGGPPGRGRGIRGRWSLASGDHGFRLHSGQSSRGTRARPGNRTGTHPPSAPWPASGSAASSPSGRCPPRPRTAYAPARC